jgi:hypothetical protein
VSQRANLYGAFRFYSMYSWLGVTPPPAVTCSAPITAAKSDGTSTYTTAASPPFFSPTASPAPTCLYLGYLFYDAGSYEGGGSGQDVVLNVQEPTISSNVAVPTALAAVLGTTSVVSSSASVYQQIGVNIIIACFSTSPPEMETLLNASLNIAADPSPVTTPSADQLPSMISKTEYEADYFPPNPQCGCTP